MAENFDYCEYVYNPLMRQYQAMVRLMQMLRDSQNADCNDVQCFTDPTDPSNPMNALNTTTGNSTASFMVTYAPMLAIWAAIMLGLFLLRPASMRSGNASEQNVQAEKRAASSLARRRNNHPNNEDDDDSTIS